MARRSRQPDARYAHRRVQVAITAGTLTAGPCTLCGKSIDVQAHHEDYANPLQVVWLCRTCHRTFDAFDGLIHVFLQHLGEILHLSPVGAVLAVGNPEIRTMLCTLPETPKNVVVRRLASSPTFPLSLLRLFLSSLTKEEVPDRFRMVREGALQIAARN